MKELEKVKRVIQKRIPDAPHETILVLDATTGQNAIQQAKSFGAATNVTGIFLAKLDGTAKGGIVVAIKNELRLPVKFVGLGEKPEDIQPFDPARFAEALLA
jgi:fused signal recognition particle receptor